MAVGISTFSATWALVLPNLRQQFGEEPCMDAKARWPKLSATWCMNNSAIAHLNHTIRAVSQRRTDSVQLNKGEFHDVYRQFHIKYECAVMLEMCVALSILPSFQHETHKGNQPCKPGFSSVEPANRGRTVKSAGQHAISASACYARVYSVTSWEWPLSLQQTN